MKEFGTLLWTIVTEILLILIKVGQWNTNSIGALLGLLRKAENVSFNVPHTVLILTYRVL